MNLPVFLAPVAGVEVEEEVQVTGPEAHHAVVVRRITAGERIELVDGVGTRATCEVTGTTKRDLIARVLAVRVEERPRPGVTVVQAIPKHDRAELSVELLTEVGVDRIVPWAAARSVGSWRGERALKAREKWRSASREAAKQSRRAWFPEVEEQVTTAEVSRLLAAADLAVVLHESAAAPLAHLPVEAAASVVVVVGPEGGLTEEEITEFRASGAHVVRLGETVLRTSTAGAVALGALLSRTARWS